MRNIQTLQLSDLIPSSIASDPQVVSAIAAIDAELQAVSAQIEVVTLIARIDELDGPTLDQLAWHFNVPFYSDDFSVVQKRGAVKRAVYWRRISGTKSAVVEALKSIQYNTEVTEWFEESGVPYTFAVDIDTEDADVSSNFLADVLSLINATKNTRSHLSRLRVAMNPPVNGIAGVGQQIGLYCATGGPLQVLGGISYPPVKLEADAYAVPYAEGDLTQPLPVYFAIGNSIGNAKIYKSDGQSFTALADPDVQSGSLIYSVDFSPNADYLAVARNGSPGIYIYKRTGDTFTKLADPSGVPGTSGGGAKFDASGEYLAVSRNGGMSIFRRSGDTFTLQSNPSGAMFSNGTASAWNSNGSILALCNYQEQPYLFSRIGAAFTKIPFPTTALPVYANGVAFSPVSDLMVCAHKDAPRVSVSSVTAGVHTRHADPAVLPTIQAEAVAFNPTGDLVVVGAQDGLFIYTVSGTTLTRISNPAGAPTNVLSVAFNPDGTVLTLGTTNAPHVFTYAVSGTTLTQISNPPSIPGQAVRGIDFS
jgi:phage tail P2-like protein